MRTTYEESSLFIILSEMKLRLGFVLVITFTIPILVAARCGRRAIPHRCANACIATCENPRPFPEVCRIDLKDCKEGCKCKSGFVMQDEGCIPRRDCNSAKSE